MLIIDREDLLLFALAIDDCSKQHINWEGRLNHVECREQLWALVEVLMLEARMKREEYPRPSKITPYKDDEGKPKKKGKK